MLKGTLKIRGMTVNTHSIADKLEDLQIILEGIRRINYEEILIEKVPSEMINKIVKEEKKSSSIWGKIKTLWQSYRA